KGAERCLGTFAGSNNDLLVRRCGGVTCGEYARYRGLTAYIDFDFAIFGQVDRALEPLGVGHQTDLNKNTFQFDLVRFAGYAIDILQTRYPCAVTIDLRGLGVGNNGDV